MAIAFSYVESTNLVVVTGGTSGTPATFADFVAADRTVKTAAASGGSGCILKAATTVTGASQVVTLTYPVRPVEYKALYLAISVSQGVGNALSGGEQITVDGTSAIWIPITGASASGQKVVPCTSTHLFQVGQTVILIDISSPSTWETDIVASISEGVSITLTNNNTNSYATGDILGIYQYETIAVAAFATFTTSYAYGQVATITYQGFDNNTTTVEQPIWGVIWNYTLDQYRIDCNFAIGDGSTSTFFKSVDEMVSFTTNNYFYTTASATLQFGNLVGSYGTRGCFVSYSLTSADTIFVSAGTLNLYNTNLHDRGDTKQTKFTGGTFTCNKAILSGEFQTGSWTGYPKISGASFSMVDTYMTSVRTIQIDNSPSAFTNTHCHNVNDALVVQNETAVDSTVTAPGLRMSSLTQEIKGGGWAAGKRTVNVVDPPVALSGLMEIQSGATSSVGEQYTCNINVCDKNGTAINGATVDCVDTTATAVWTAGTVTTNASGNITEQTITYKRWVGTSEVLTTYSPHKFTISKAGYKTLVLDNITVSTPIKWHLELQNTMDNNFSKMARINS